MNRVRCTAPLVGGPHDGDRVLVSRGDGEGAHGVADVHADGGVVPGVRRLDAQLTVTGGAHTVHFAVGGGDEGEVFARGD